MKTYNITNRLSQQARNEITRILNVNEKYRKAYFWKPAPTADGRRRNEKKFAEGNPDVVLLKGDETIHVSMDYSESCKNVYYRMNVVVDGEPKDARFLKKIVS